MQIIFKTLVVILFLISFFFGFLVTKNLEFYFPQEEEKIKEVIPVKKIEPENKEIFVKMNPKINQFSRGEDLIFRFSKNIIPEKVKEKIHFSPKILGKISFPDEKTMIFDPDFDSLPPGEEIFLKIDNGNIGENEEKFSGARFFFQVPRIEFKGIKVNSPSEIEVFFNFPIDLEIFFKNSEIHPPRKEREDEFFHHPDFAESFLITFFPPLSPDSVLVIFPDMFVLKNGEKFGKNMGKVINQNIFEKRPKINFMSEKNFWENSKISFQSDLSKVKIAKKKINFNRFSDLFKFNRKIKNFKTPKVNLKTKITKNFEKFWKLKHF